MNRFITKDNLNIFAYINKEYIEGEIRGVVINFHGINDLKFINSFTPGEKEKYLGSKGILTVAPFSSPWAWMNKRTLDFTDEILDVVFNEVIGRRVPLVLTGGSMGGHDALIYSIRGKHAACGISLNCGVCDMSAFGTYMYKSWYCAYGDEDGDLMDVVIANSPLHLADTLPDLPYLFAMGYKDTAVPPSKHGEVLGRVLAEKGFNISYIKVTEMGHCNLSDFPNELRLYNDFAIRCITDATQLYK